jgi:hypothetical protein
VHRDVTLVLAISLAAHKTLPLEHVQGACHGRFRQAERARQVPHGVGARLHEDRQQQRELAGSASADTRRIISSDVIAWDAIRHAPVQPANRPEGVAANPESAP